MLVTQSCLTLFDPFQASVSVEFSRQECLSGLPFPPPGDLPNQSILGLLLYRQILYCLSHQGSSVEVQ